jgi:four helix bundle protein
MMQDFRNLMVWRKGHQLALNIYGLTGEFPKDERYGLTAQLRKAAVSIVANIAEGCGRRSSAEMARFLDIAFGSACEVERLLVLSFDLGFLSGSWHAGVIPQVVEVKKMLASLGRKLTSDS